MLGNLNLLHELTQGSTIACAVLTRDTNLLRALTHFLRVVGENGGGGVGG